MGNPCGFKSQFGVFTINPYGPQWKGFSWNKRQNWPIQVPKDACGSRHSISLNHASNSMFYTQEEVLRCEFSLMEYDGVLRFEFDILGIKYDISSI